MSVTGTLLSVYSVRPDLQQWYRSVELLTTVPVLAVLATGMLAMSQAVVGQFYVAVVVALLPGMYSARSRS